MPEYRCLLHVCVFTKDGHSTGTAKVMLPFVPFPGLRIFGVSQSTEGEKIECVTWDILGSGFVLCLPSNNDEDSTFSQTRDFYGPAWEWAS
jgi:hypothetical protein